MRKLNNLQRVSGNADVFNKYCTRLARWQRVDIAANWHACFGAAEQDLDHIKRGGRQWWQFDRRWGSGCARPYPAQLQAVEVECGAMRQRATNGRAGHDDLCHPKLVIRVLALLGAPGQARFGVRQCIRKLFVACWIL